jgi:hypothetical protein
VRRHNDAVCIQLPHLIEDLEGGTSVRNDERLNRHVISQGGGYSTQTSLCVINRLLLVTPPIHALDRHRRLRKRHLDKRDAP